MKRTLAPAVLVILLAAGMVVGCDKAPPKAKRAQVVKLLPDSPPPPPKPEEKRPEPPKDERPQPQALPEAKPVAQPEAQTLKSDEAAGQGPGSGLTAGPVRQDYVGGAIGAASGPQIGGVNRVVFDSFAQAATRSLNDFLAAERALRQADYRLAVHVWLGADGRMQRAELVGTSGDAQLDAALRDALLRFPGTAAPVPERMPQPIRLRISNRMIG